MGNERVYECLNYNSIAYLQMKAFLSAGENTAENRKDDRKIVENKYTGTRNLGNFVARQGSSGKKIRQVIT